MDLSYHHHRNQIIEAYSALSLSDMKIRESYFIQLFQFQYKYNEIYQSYCQNLGVFAQNVTNIDQIPYLPISAFKNHIVKTGNFDAQEVFRSSGTTASIRSSHHVRDVSHYLANTVQI